jgi:Leucine-rich repeat (LRR) protein
VVVAVVSVAVVYGTKSAQGADVTEMTVLWDGDPSAAPTAPPSTNREASGIREQVEAGILQRGANFSTIDEDDPRYKALNWILHYDQLQLDSDDKNLYQRYVLALLAFSLDSTAWYACGEHRKFGNVTENFVTESCEVANHATGQVEEHGVWLSSTEECTWYGVICSSDEVVRGVELIGNDLIGELPPEISQLRFLQYLALNGNCLYGTVPPELGQMPNLLSLELHGNGLSGDLPVELYDASKLQLLNVAMQYGYAVQCRMTNGTLVNTLLRRGGVTIPREPNPGLGGKVLSKDVDRWTSMKGLHLFDNSISGNITDAIGNLKYLVFLRAQNNVISGMVPAGLVKLEKLREVYLDKNNIWSDIPPDIGFMEDLEVLRVNENEMFGKIPESLYDLRKLKKLWLQDTLSCEQVLKGDQKVWECDIDSEKGFEGTIGKRIGNLKKLSQLLISNNPINGTIPKEIGLCEDLSLLLMHKTAITGSSPLELCLLRDKSLNNEANAGVFYADCRPNNKTGDPFFSCNCCSDCCDHTTKVCIADD